MTNPADIAGVRGGRLWNWSQLGGYLYLHDCVVQAVHGPLLFHITEMRYMPSNSIQQQLHLGVQSELLFLSTVSG
jgi:hypothetical protein